MRGRTLFSGVLVVVCLATLWGVWGQRSQLAGLRAEQRQLMAQLTAKGDGSVSPVSAEVVSTGPGTGALALAATPELLRLRSEVTRLTERRRELASVRGENERLHAQVASRGTNGPGGLQLPPGYLRKSEARLVGFSTPEDTLQSLLWAIRNHDLTNLLQAFTPERAEEFRARAGESSESIANFFREAAGFVGMRVVKREQDASNGTIALELEVLPGESGPRVSFLQTNSQWKIAGPF